MTARNSAELLTADEALRLAEFARACKAAARVVALYPATHPAIQASLARVAESAGRLGAGTAVLTVLPDDLLLDGRAAAKPDGSLAELAALLHVHLIGELQLTGELVPTAWHTFLGLIARSPEDIRAQGGIARAWQSAGGGPIEIRQIDYGEVLRERDGGLDSDWDRIIDNYLEGELSDFDDEAVAALLDLAGDPNRFREFTERLVSKASGAGRSGQKDVVVRVLQALADYTAREQPEQLDRVLHRIASVLPQLTPDLVVSLVTTGATAADGAAPGIELPGEIRARLSDEIVAEFVAQSVSRDHGATARLAEAFEALVPDTASRERLLNLAEEEARQLAIGRSPEFPDLWKRAAEMLATYSDSRFVSGDYGRELARTRAQAIEVDRVSDDPPQRVSAWLSTVTESAIRQLDYQLLFDLLAIEVRPEAWHTVLDAAVESIDQAVLTGDLVHAQRLLDALLAATRKPAPFAEAAHAGLERLRTGALMRNVVLVIRQADDAEVPAISKFCQALGPAAIGPLAEALANEQGGAVKRLGEVLLGFGGAGRAYADELRSSPNPAVRRTAIALLRAFGGEDALPDLASLLEDAEPAIQREALRAIVQIGTNEAYATLQAALKSSNVRTRDTIIQALSASRDVRAAPLFVYILEHSDHRGQLEPVHLSAIEALGKIGGDAESVGALSRILHRGEWWAPLRTRRLRAAAALALRSCGSAEAQSALEGAAGNGLPGVRRAARAALKIAVTRSPRRAS
jgi:hypothetical protein